MDNQERSTDNKDKRLYDLDDIDYKVESDDPDVRGWDVKDKADRKVGKIDDMLVDKDREKVVYLDVDVDDEIIEEGHEPLSTPDQEGTHEFTNSEGEDHLIIPIGMAAVNQDEQCVRCDEISYDTFAGTKRFKKGELINKEYEQYIIDRYSSDFDWEAQDDDGDFYEGKAFQISEYRIG